MDKMISANVAKNIKKYRKLKKWTQLRLSVESGVTPSTIGTIETAAADTSLSKLGAIAKALGVEPWELLRFE